MNSPLRKGTRPAARRDPRRGAVLMEYVALCCFVAVVLLSFMHVAVYVDGVPVSGFFDFRQGYVGLGAEWADRVRLLHRAVALPFP